MRAGLIALLVLPAAACATAPTPDLGAPAPMENFDWFFHEDGARASLAYGLAESDYVGIALSCDRGSGRLELMRDIPAEARPEIIVESGGDTERFAAASEPSLLTGGQIVTARARTDLPVFQRFRRLGWLAVWQDGRRETYAPHPASAGRIERFFAACG